jgi:hypothetical protein
MIIPHFNQVLVSFTMLFFLLLVSTLVCMSNLSSALPGLDRHMIGLVDNEGGLRLSMLIAMPRLPPSRVKKLLTHHNISCVHNPSVHPRLQSLRHISLPLQDILSTTLKPLQHVRATRRRCPAYHHHSLRSRRDHWSARPDLW